MVDGLAEAIENARQEILEENKEAGVETQTEETPTEEIEEGSEGDPGDEDPAANDNVEELDEASVDEAKRLYKALRDPKAGPAVLAALAQQAGLLGRNAPETKAETKAAKRAVTEILSEALGKDYAFLADKLGPAIEAVFEQHETALDEKFSRIEAEKVETQVVAATRELNRLTKGESGKLEARMAELSNEMPPAPGISVEKYLKNLFVLAGGKLPTGVNTKIQNERIQRNANDTSDRVNGRSTSSSATRDGVPVAKNLDEAISLAQAQLKKGKNTW